MAGLALIEGRSDVGDEARIRPTLGHHTLPNITYSIVVEVWEGSDQGITPVVVAQGYLLLWREL